MALPTMRDPRGPTPIGRRVLRPPAGSRRTVPPRRNAEQPTPSARACAPIHSTHNTRPIRDLTFHSPPLWGEGIQREAHVPAKEASSRARTWFPRANEDDRWAQSARRSSRAWPQAHHRRLNRDRVARAARLRRSTDIKNVRTSGRASRRRTFLARAAASAASTSRIAVVAPGTVGKAVTRNRARRRVREAFQRAFASATASRSIDLVVTVRAEAASAPFEAIATDAKTTLAELAR